MCYMEDWTQIRSFAMIKRIKFHEDSICSFGNTHLLTVH